MPRRTESRTRRQRHTDPAPPPSRTDPPVTGGLTDAQVERLAAWLADGRGEAPAGLSGADRLRLESAVRGHLRRRLVHLIARAVAADIRRTARAGTETDPHVTPEV
jgi:hypothetical protein